MATCTAITSGDDNAAGTWSGGLIPSTTFAGTRTTSSGPTAIGATSIPVSAAAQVVTAGKWLMVAGEYYRVATGVAGGSAGNIVIDAPGLRVVVTSGATISVDMVDDQVVIPHPGTNKLGSGTQYTTDSAGYAIGATSINLITGTGTILAGECVQFGSDPEYYKVQTTLTAGVLVLTAPGLTTAIPAAPTAVVNAGYVVTWVSANKPVGNDTFNISTLLSNGIAVSGTLKFASTGSPTMICRGTVFIDPLGGTIDLGPTARPTPNGTIRTMVLNDSATLSTGKHGITISNTFSGSYRFMANGRQIKRNAKLTAIATAGQNQITVSDSTGWAIGDPIVIQSDTTDTSRKLRTTLVSGSHPTWTLADNINFTRQANTNVGNLGGNVVFKSYDKQFPAFINLFRSSASCKIIPDIKSGVRLEGIGAASVTGLSFTGLGVCSYADVVLSGIASEWIGTPTLSASATGAISLAGGNIGRVLLQNSALNCPSTSAVHALQIAFSAEGSTSDVVIYDSASGVATISSGPSDFTFSGDVNARVSSIVAGVSALKVDQATLNSFGAGGVAAITPTNGYAVITNSKIDNPNRLIETGNFTPFKVQLTNVTLLNGALTGSYSGVSVQGRDAGALINGINGDPGDCRDNNGWRYCTTDATTRRHGTQSVKIQPLVANTAAIYVFKIPAVAGVAQVIKGSLRFDAAYGATNPPVIALSGQGVTASYTCSAVADAWDDFTLSFTPASTGDITVTITVQSASTTGYAWLDGVYHYPMIQAVRHWGYQWLPQAAQLVDTRITLTEAAALALPVSVNRGASTVNITGSVTPSQALQAMLADLAQTANNAVPVHVTGDGSTFATTHTVVLSGSGAVSGPYTDATGLHVSITSSALDAGTLVQVWDVVAATELYIGTPSGAMSLPIVYPGADKTLRLRAMQCGAASASRFAEQLGTLTSAGASFLVTQTPDTVYAANAIDGSTVTGITIDDTPMRFVLAGRTSISWAEIYAYETWWLSTVAGMRDDGRIITAIDPANYVLEGFQLRNDNPGGAPITLTGGWGRDSVTGQTITLIDTTGGPIFAAPDAVIAYGQSAATPAEIWSHTSRTLTSDPGAAGHAATQAAIAALPAPPSAAAVASATRTELAPELAATLQARDLAEADEIFTPGTAAGTGLLSFKRRGTAVDLIPAKTISGTSQAEASGATQ